ncbi:MAG: M16 family metallopeptidase [Solirubrobacterales bacterium]
MKKCILENGVRLIYEKRDIGIASFCIGFNAGALMESGFKIGTAHALEHVVFKGTLKRSEDEINTLCDEIFGFNNAMTNYPYVIYYGTTITSDFENGLELYSDIVLNPSFPETGFKEEINVIMEELRDWKEDMFQNCEDKLFYNAFQSRRIKETIIGTVADIGSINLEDIKNFYNKFYVPSNCVISVVTSMTFDEVYKIINKYFGNMQDNKHEDVIEYKYENNIPGIFQNTMEGSTGARIQYCFPIHQLNIREIKILKLISFYLGESLTSILYDEIRTKKGLAYDLKSKVADENGIKLLYIIASTSRENTEQVIDIINNIIEGIRFTSVQDITLDKVKNIIKMLKIRRELLLEKSIQLSKELTCYEIMYNSPLEVYIEFDELDSITIDEIKEVINKTFRKPSIQILK